MRRDNFGIIIQHNYEHPDDSLSYDGGDSICRTGIMAMCGSEIDKQIMMGFYSKDNGEIVRHPKQARWNEYKEMSRDQLVCAVAGMIHSQAEPVRKRHWLLINKDVLMPDIKLHLAICADHWSKYIWGLIGYPWLIISILWSCFIKTEHELNQILCVCYKAGKPFLKLLCSLHPDWERNVNEYWWSGHGFWRDQKEIAETLIQAVKLKGNLK